MAGYVHQNKLKEHIRRLKVERDEWRRKAEEKNHDVKLDNLDQVQEIAALVEDAKISYRQLSTARRERDRYRAEVYALRDITEERDMLAQRVDTCEALISSYENKVKALKFDLVTERNRTILRAS